MTHWLKQATAVTIPFGPFADQTDGFTAETGLTIEQADIRLSKNGGDFAQVSVATALTHDEAGFYPVALATTDVGTLGNLVAAAHISGARPVKVDCVILPANVWDSLFSTDKLEVDVTQISGDATAPANLEAMFDGTGYIGGALKFRTDSSYATIDGSYTLKDLTRLIAAVLLGKLSGGGTVTATFRDTADGVDRVVATIDADGNRTTVVLDATDA